MLSFYCPGYNCTKLKSLNTVVAPLEAAQLRRTLTAGGLGSVKQCGDCATSLNCFLPTNPLLRLSSQWNRRHAA